MQHLIIPLRAVPATPRASTSCTSTLPLALQAAIAARQIEQLHALLLRHGPDFFAHALAVLTQRQRADVLSLLGAQERAVVYRHLPAAARRQWLQAAVAARRPLRYRLLRACQHQWRWLRDALRSNRA